jgi:uncharacterized protein YegL
LRRGLLAAALSITAAAANAAGSVAWLSPPNGASFPVGTSVAPTGQASATGTVGGNLDLVLVLDSSGSMASNVSLPSGTISRRQLQQDAANALVNNLPAGTNVGVVDFDGSASVVQTLTSIPSAGVTNAINGIDASGFTDIAAGITAADNELDARGTPGNSQQILLISDGGSSQFAAEAAATTAAASGYTVNTVGFPGASNSVLQAVATAGGGTFVNFDGNPQDIVDVFSGSQGGVLVGVQGVQITDPDGNSYAATVNALGGFTANGFNLNLGANTFTALATFTDQSTASATLTLFGTQNGTAPPVPLPASALLLLGGLGALGALRRRRRS